MEPKDGSQEPVVSNQKPSNTTVDQNELAKLQLKAEIYDLSVGINRANQRIAQLEAELRKL